MEIKPQELRLTNLVEWNKEACTVQSIRGNDIGLYDRNKALICTTTKLINPIELTPEWLEKFKFNKHHYLGHDIMWRHPNDKKTVEKILHSCNFYWQDKKFVFIEVVNDHGEYATFPIGHIKYIHQLQNLFFSLTGEELAIDKQISNGN